MTDRELEIAIRKAIPPMGDVELRRDLWPEMLGRLESKRIRLSWVDWALAGGLVAACGWFPGALPALLYHL